MVNTTFEKKFMSLKKIECCDYPITSGNVSHRCVITHREKYLSWGGAKIYTAHKQIQRKVLNMYFTCTLHYSKQRA